MASGFADTNMWKYVPPVGFTDYLTTAKANNKGIDLANALEKINSLDSPEYLILAETGLALEDQREKLANLARSDYATYAEQKQLAKNAIKSEVLRSYAVTFAEFQRIGYPPDICKARALEAALATQKIQSEVFQSLYKNQGKPVQDIY